MQKDKAADGLRGLAALNVVLCHFLGAIYPLGFENLYPGVSGPGAIPSRVSSFLSIPMVSLFWNGNFAVCVFFVLSGYVLAKPFIENGDADSLKLRAARRYFRLVVPVVGSVLFAYILVKLGFNHTKQLAAISHNVPLDHSWTDPPDFFIALKEGFFGGIFEGRSFLVPVLWTMKIEFIGSMIVFAYWSLNLAGMAGIIWLCISSAVIVHCFPDEWMLYLGFLGGTYLNYVKAPQPKWMMATAILLAIFCGGFDNSALYKFANFIPMYFYPRKHIFNILGAILLLYAIRGGAFQRILSSMPAQFLGKVSYPLYLVHQTIIFAFSSMLFVNLYQHLHLKVWEAAAIDLLATLMVALTIASIFEATFDSYGIRLSKWIIATPKIPVVNRLNRSTSQAQGKSPDADSIP